LQPLCVCLLCGDNLGFVPTLLIAGSRMLHEPHAELAGRGIALRVIGAYAPVREACGVMAFLG
jgi:hypothetical protein